MTVRELCDVVSAAVSGAFGSEVWVRGTISGLKRHPSGAVYFDMVDDGDQLGSATSAVLSVALFEQDRHRVNKILRKAAAQGVRMNDGMEILIRGAVRYNARSGRIQLKMSLIDPAYTVGRMEIAKAVLISELKAEGIYDANKTLELDVLPLTVALVTSANSAAEADFVNQLMASGYPFKVHLFDTRVQGDGAVSSIKSALMTISRDHVAYSAIAIVRGGGARADLVAFDHGDVVRAIATAGVPVIIGVGHDSDRSLADEVAHTSTKTPTACAAHLIDQVGLFEARVLRASQSLAHIGQMALRAETARLETISKRLGLAPNNRLGAEAHRLSNCEVRARALDPARALARGWSITTTAEGTAVGSIADVGPGVELITRVADGYIRSKVSTVEPQPQESA